MESRVAQPSAEAQGQVAAEWEAICAEGLIAPEDTEQEEAA